MQDSYFVASGGETKGPFAADQLSEMWRSGALTADTQYWNDADEQWHALGDLIRGHSQVAGNGAMLVQPDQHARTGWVCSRRVFMVAFIVMVVISCLYSRYGASTSSQAQGFAYVETAFWMSFAIGRLRDIGWPWWVTFLGLAPGGGAGLSIFLIAAPSGYSKLPKGRLLPILSGIAQIVFGWVQIAIIVWFVSQEGTTHLSRLGKANETAVSLATRTAAQAYKSQPSPSPNTTIAQQGTSLASPGHDLSLTVYSDAQYEAALRASWRNAFSRHPSLQVPGSPACKYLQQRINEIWELNPHFFDDPRWPEAITTRYVADLMDFDR